MLSAAGVQRGSTFINMLRGVLIRLVAACTGTSRDIVSASRLSVGNGLICQ